jgi:hypothetical protein
VDPTILAGQALALLSPYLTRLGDAALHQAGEAAAQHAEAIISAIRRQFGADHDGFAEQTLDAVLKQPDDASPKQALQGIVASKVEKDPAFKSELERLLKEATDNAQTQQFLVQVYGHGKVNEIFQIHTVNTLNVGRHDTSD